MSSSAKLGPKMAALSPRRQAFVRALFSQSRHDAKAAAREAGYKESPNGLGLAVQAHHLWHDDTIQAAIEEEAHRRFRGLAPSALNVLSEVMENPQEGGATRVKAAQVIFDRAGLHAVSERITTEIPLEKNPIQVERMMALAHVLGKSFEELVGSRIKRIEAPTEEAMYIEMSNEGLEGLI